MKKIVIAALEKELADRFQDQEVVYSGVGKVNAAWATTHAIMSQKPDIVFNFGTCGSPDLEIGTFVSCVEFIQYDMDCALLGVEPGFTYGEAYNKVKMPFPLPGIKKARCLTQDRYLAIPYDPEPGPPEIFDPPEIFN